MSNRFYVNNKIGKKSFSGLDPSHPVPSYKDINISPGDTVLFSCGCIFDEIITAPGGTPESPITFDCYGEGNKPVFSAAQTLNDESLWIETSSNIWKFMGFIESEVCNIIYDNSYGNLCWEMEELKSQGEWYYSHIGYTNRECPEKLKNTPRELFIYSIGNPARVYGSIIACLFGERYLASAKSYVNLKNLEFKYSGVHGFLGINTTGITISNCKFSFIGGAVWQRDRKIRFGNGVEFWNDAEDIVVENCEFDNIYDSCVTHQGGKAYGIPKNITIKNNSFSNYGMAAYEIRDKVTLNTVFSGNFCDLAGEGISVQSDERPRNSEIYPQPMGHHIYIWRIENATENGKIEISNNHFGKADYGSAIYSIASKLPKGQFLIENNTFEDTENNNLIKWENEYISLQKFLKEVN